MMETLTTILNMNGYSNMSALHMPVLHIMKLKKYI